MAGRAGRRGLDTVGTVIICAFGSEPPPMPMLRTMLTGQSTLLKSQFRLTYNVSIFYNGSTLQLRDISQPSDFLYLLPQMILNLLRVEEMSVESMIKRSFSEFATQRALTANEYPKLLARGTNTLSKMDESIQVEANLRIGAEDVEEYYRACKLLLAANNDILSYITEVTNGSAEGVLQSGRILLVSAARKYGLVRAPAVVLRPSLRKTGSSESSTIICLVLLPDSYVPREGVKDARLTKMPANIGYIGSAEHRYFQLCEIALVEVLIITSKKYKDVSVKDLLQDSSSNSSGAQRPGSREFFAAATTGGRKTDDNIFSGMKSLGEGKGAHSKAGGASNTGQGIDRVIQYLIAAEESERGAGLPVMDIKECARCGSDVVEFRQLFSRMENLTAEVRSSFVSHRHPGLERIYTP